MDNSSPYKLIPRRQMWGGMRDDFSQNHFFSDFWRPKFTIKETDTFSTMGSCFAQHIGRALRKSGLEFKEFERPVGALENEAMHGYGLFSFRLGNVYTAKTLGKWIELLASQDNSADALRANGRFFDPLRLTIEPDGFSSQEYLGEARIRSLTALREGISKTDNFIFTMGLTESWELPDGTPLSSHPSIVGCSEPAILKCYDYDEVLEDMTRALKRMREVNPRIHVILTVSPVPLTATVRDQHVISATVASKSILRAVADNLSKTFEWVDYFPSYELITNHVSSSTMPPFLPNQRQVTDEAVQFVMHHFLEGLQARHPSIRHTPNEKNVFQSVDEWCEENQMVSLGTQLEEPQKPTDTADYILIGDSHCGLLQQAFTNLGIPAIGGAIQQGSSWDKGGFALVEDEIFVPLESAEARKNWRAIYSQIRNSGSNTRYVVTNVGAQTHRSVPSFIDFVLARTKNITLPEFTAFVTARYQDQFTLLSKLAALDNIEVLFLIDPPTRNLDIEERKLLDVYHLYDEWLAALVKRLNCKVIEPSKSFLLDQHESIYSETVFGDGGRDRTHGNQYYYSLLAKHIVELTCSNSQ